MISALPCLPSVSKYVTPSKCNDLSQMKPIQLNPFYLLNRACPLEICCLLIIDPMRKIQNLFLHVFTKGIQKIRDSLCTKKNWFKKTYLIKTHNPSLPRSSLIKSQEFCTKWICLTVKYLPSSCPLTLGGTGHVIAWFPIAGHPNVGLVGLSSQNLKKKSHKLSQPWCICFDVFSALSHWVSCLLKSVQLSSGIFRCSPKC